MTEPNEIEFREPVHPNRSRSVTVRAAFVAAIALVAVGVVAAVVLASPSTAIGADPSADPSAGTNPAASAAPGTVPPKGDRPGWKAFGPGFGPGFGGFGRFGFNDITITAIDGSNVSLETADGWTRTIAITDATTITKGGATIDVADLAVGDHVRIAQDRSADGTVTVTAVVVVLPTIVGEVTAIDGDTITVTQRGGTTATIHVSGDTTYRAGRETGSKSDVKVGSVIVAEGTQRADGSLDASTVQTGLDRPGGHGPDWKRDHDYGAAPDASPAPSSGPS